MGKPVVLVLGATGLVGSATIKYLSTSSATKLDIRAGTRNPDKAPDSVKLPGVQVVKVALGDDKEHLKRAFTGVDALYIIPPGATTIPDTTREALTVAKEAGVKHYVLLIGQTAHIPPTHKYAFHPPTAYDLQKKALEVVPDATVLCVPFFMENHLGFVPTISAQSKFIGALDPNKRMAWMSADDAGKMSAVILSDPEKHRGKYYWLLSDSVSNNEIANYISEAVGKKVAYEHITYEQYAASSPMAAMVSNYFHLVEEGFEPLTRGATQDHFNVTGEHPRTMQQWCQQNAHLLKGN